MTRRDKTRFKIWLAVVGVFTLGCVTGASLVSAYRSQAGAPEARAREDLFGQLRRELRLSEQQTGHVRAIIEETRDKYRELRSECRPRYDAARASARERMRALLTPEQRQTFDAIVAERDATRDRDKRERR